MNDIAIAYDATARLTVFAGVLAVLILWERRAATRQPGSALGRRWSTNFGMGAIDALIVRLIFPAGAVGAAMLAAKHHVGLFHHAALSANAAIVSSVLLLDVTIYLQHRLFHALPWLWRIHRVHHADPQVDVSTALRFHPLESVLSMLLKAGVVLAFGMPVLGVLLFEIILNAAAMFNHTNASLPQRMERWLRFVLVTPEMHRIHHAADARANRNFGFSVSWWDRLFGSYSAPAGPPADVSIGLPDGVAAPEHVRLHGALLMPFKR